MSKRFLIRRVLVVPTLVFLMAVPQVTYAMSDSGVDRFMNSGEQIMTSQVIDVEKESTRNTDALLNNIQIESQPVATNISTNATSTQTQSARQEFEDGIMKLFSTTKRGNTLYGELSTSMGYEADEIGNPRAGELVEKHGDNPTLSSVVIRPTIQKIINENKTELGRLASVLYQDISGTEYWAYAVSLPSFYSCISGRENGKFFGESGITRQEIAVAVNKCMLNGKENINTFKYDDLVATGAASWASGHMAQITGFESYHKMGGNQSAIYNENCPRQEIAYILADTLHLDIHKGGKYWNLAGQGNTGTFTDITGVLTKADLGITEDTSSADEAKIYLETFKRTDGKISQKYLAALLALNDLNIMRGGTGGEAMANNQVRRGDFLILVNGCLAYKGSQMK